MTLRYTLISQRAYTFFNKVGQLVQKLQLRATLDTESMSVWKFHIYLFKKEIRTKEKTVSFYTGHTDFPLIQSPDRLLKAHYFLSNVYCGFFARDKAGRAWRWPRMFSSADVKNA
jgi:hypothetical protein